MSARTRSSQRRYCVTPLRSSASPMSDRRNWNSALLSCFAGLHADESTAHRAMPVAATAAAHAFDATDCRHFFDAHPFTGSLSRTRSLPAADVASSTATHRVPTGSVVT